MALPNKAGFWKNRTFPRTRLKDVSAANKWFLSKADHELSDIADPDTVWGGRRRQSNLPQIGSMYMWRYKAKHDKTLPTWDMFPLGFIFDMKGPHFWGLNFHYLPPQQRYQLGAALMKARVRAKGRKNDYLKLSFSIIQNVAKAKLYEPCVKQYLFKQMGTKFHYIEPDEWALATQLGIERWKRGKPY